MSNPGGLAGLKQGGMLGSAGSVLLSNWKVVLGGLAAIWAANKISGKDDAYNYIEGMRHGGISGETRRYSTNFGSGWTGLNEFGSDLARATIEEYVLQDPVGIMHGFENLGSKIAQIAPRRSQRQDKAPSERVIRPDGLNQNYSNAMYAISSIDDYTVEDADTITAQMAGQRVSFRLAGIDAPEISHDDPSRVNQDQPYGEEAKSRLQEMLDSQNSLQVLLDPSQSTYGRSVGVIMGDNGKNINLDLVREGAAAALPFGPRGSQIFSATEFSRAEADAAAAQRGMWDYEGWAAVRAAQENSKRRTTNTSYTDMERLFSNFKTSALALRLNGDSEEMSAMLAAGGKDDFNVIEGMRHGWFGASRRANIEDFGSGYILKKAIPTTPASFKVKRTLVTSSKIANSNAKKMMKRENLIRHNLG